MIKTIYNTKLEEIKPNLVFHGDNLENKTYHIFLVDAGQIIFEKYVLKAA